MVRQLQKTASKTVIEKPGSRDREISTIIPLQNTQCATEVLILRSLL
jgi:hypothetical protein